MAPRREQIKIATDADMKKKKWGQYEKTTTKRLRLAILTSIDWPQTRLGRREGWRPSADRLKATGKKGWHKNKRRKINA